MPGVDPKRLPVFGWLGLFDDPFEAPFPDPFCPPLPPPKVNAPDIFLGCGGQELWEL